MKFDITKMKNINEVAPTQVGGRLKLGASEIRIGVSVKGTKKEHPQALARIILGNEIIEQLRWQKGDVVSILFDEKYLLIKRDNAGRYTLQKYERGKYISWRIGISLFAGMPCASTTINIPSQNVEWKWVENQTAILITMPQVS